ncbi:MAG: DUF4340 domain-containing protein [Deltaproteobacteria bacterium]|nr:DUF4340 domain-containing protein [Deltaproteobacteria bacterium]
MKRVHRMLLTALFAGGVPGALAIYTYTTNISTRVERAHEEKESRRLFHFGRDHVQRAELFARGATLTFERETDGSFRITAPFTWPADSRAIEQALSHLSVLRLRETPTTDATPADLEAAGLDKPIASLKVSTTKGDFAAYFGPRNALVDAYPVTDQTRQRIGLAETPVVDAIDRDANAFRERRVFPISADEIAEVAIVRPEGSVRIQRGNDDVWMLASAKGPEVADPDRVSSLLVALTERLRVEAFLADNISPPSASSPSPAGSSGGSPRARSLVAPPSEHPAAHSAEPPAKAELSPPIFEIEIVTRRHHHPPETDHYHAWLGLDASTDTNIMYLENTGSRLRVPAFIREALDRSEAYFEDRTLCSFEPNAVARIEFDVPLGTLAIERTEDSSGWRMTAPREAPVKVWKVDSILRTYSRLKAVRFHGPAASSTQLRDWHLVPPARSVRFFGASGENLANLSIGNREDEDTRFALLDGTSRVALIAEAKIAILPDTPASLIDDESPAHQQPSPSGGDPG